jgi:bifunctional DNase/RNase
MNKPIVPVEVRGLIPTNAGVAVFLGNEEKVFTIYVDHTVGNAIGMFMNNTEKERPLTHDLMALLMQALGAKVQHVVINDLKSGTYFGRLILTVENELQQKKIIELDARPSDCIALATQQKAPIFVSKEVWEEVDDMSDVLRQMAEESQQGTPDDEEEGPSSEHE